MKTKIKIEGLEEAILAQAQEKCRKAAAKIRDELYEEGKLAIEEFYNSYNPIYYRRHYYNFYNKSFKKYYSNAHGNIYIGGIELTPENLDEIYQDPASEVFDTVYAGLHGPAGAITFGYSGVNESPRNFSPVPRSSSPMQRLLDKRDYIVAHIEEYF